MIETTNYKGLLDGLEAQGMDAEAAAVCELVAINAELLAALKYTKSAIHRFLQHSDAAAPAYLADLTTDLAVSRAQAQAAIAKAEAVRA